MKQIQPIRNKKDCDAATREIERLMEKETSKKLTKAEAARLDVLATLVDAYESALVQNVPTDPIEALKFRLEQLGLPLADLARTLGSRPRASEVLSRKRRMTLPMIRKIHEEYGVPPEVLIQDYPLERTGAGPTWSLRPLSSRGCRQARERTPSVPPCSIAQCRGTSGPRS